MGKVDTVAAKRRKCDSCSELHSRTFELPCSHLFCKDCTRGLFESALNDKAYMPVKCCGKRVDQRRMARAASGMRMLAKDEKMIAGRMVGK
mgnify:CR=1 FL=1